MTIKRERGNTLVIMAFFMVAVLVLIAALVDLAQIRQAEIHSTQALAAAADAAARTDLASSTLYRVALCTPGGICRRNPRVLMPQSGSVPLSVAQRVLADELESVAYLLNGVTPAQVAATAQIVTVVPRGGACVPSPFAEPSGHLETCYYDPFVAARVVVPLKALWGGFGYKYPVMVVSALTDDPDVQTVATPIPTRTPLGVIPTVGVVPTHCPVTVCKDN